MTAGGQTMENTWLMEAYQLSPPWWAKMGISSPQKCECCGSWKKAITVYEFKCDNFENCELHKS